LSYLHCIGILMTVNCLKTPRFDDKKSENTDAIKSMVVFVGLFLSPWLTLFVGYIFKICFLS